MIPGVFDATPGALRRTLMAMRPLLTAALAMPLLAQEVSYLRVPEDRSDPKSRTIELAYLRLPSTATRPGPPIVYLAGGPGGSGIQAAQGPRAPLFQALREFGDVIAFDQRGTGRSRPSLACTETWDFDPAQARTYDSMLALARQRFQTCSQRLAKQGVRITAYTTEASADDLDDLRRALGAEKITLWGISYGTHLALAALKRHQSRIAGMILAGVEGPDHTFKLPSNLEASLRAVDAAAQQEGSPPLSPRLRGARDGLRREPARVTTAGQDVSVSEFDLQVAVTLAMQDRNTLRQLAGLTDRLAAGDFRPLGAQLLALRRQPVFSMLAIMANCASGATAARRRRIEQEAGPALLGRTMDFPHPEICAAWPALDHGDAFRSPVRSHVPALIISGTLDSRTPPRNAEEVRTGLPNSTHLVIENAGHDNDLFLSSPKILDTMRAFLRGEKLADLRISAGPVGFVTPPPTSAQTGPDPFLGMWILNVAQSKFTPGPPPRDLKVTWEREGDGLRVTSQGTDGRGRPIAITYKAVYDGKPYPPAGPWNWDAVTNRQINANLREDTFTKSGKVIGTIRREVSQDGKTMTVTAEFGPERSIEVFEKR